MPNLETQEYHEVKAPSRRCPDLISSSSTTSTHIEGSTTQRPVDEKPVSAVFATISQPLPGRYIHQLEPKERMPVARVNSSALILPWWRAIHPAVRTPMIPQTK